MALNDRNRRKGAEKAQQLVPQARVVDYVIGREGANPVIVVGALVAAAAGVSIIILLATGALVIPGILVILVVQHLASPPRGLAVCDRGIAVTHRSLWNGKPSKVGHLVDFGHVRPVREQAGRTEVEVGPVKIWMAKNEAERLRTSLAGAPPA